MMLEKIVKLRKSRTETCDLTKTKNSSHFFIFFCQKNECFTSFTLYGARVRGNVFKIEFRVFSREFESIETSPGFAQLLGENWN